MVSCWGITSGSAGMAAQVRALAEALGLEPVMKNVTVRKPWVWLPNSLYVAGLDKFVMPKMIGKGSDHLSPPWPDIVISCGRRGAIAALGLRKVIPPTTRFIHIQDPHISARHFDLIVAMEHDRITGANVLKTRFALHSITPAGLASAKARFAAEFSQYPKPHIAVLFGGSTNKYHLMPGDMQKTVFALQELLAATRGSLLITPSRRTGEENIAALHEAFASEPRAYIYDFAGENPYMGMLALADFIVVTNDSVNMMSDAYATGKPIFILPFSGHHAHTKPARFAARLMADGIARHVSAPLEPWDYPIKNEMQDLAAEIKRRLALR